MKKNILLFILCIAFFSCENDNTDINVQDQESDIQSSTLLDSFVKTLSEVLFSEEPVREFVKSEALKMFDNDNEVYYPEIKNTALVNGETLRDYMVKYGNDAIADIDEKYPLLTLLIPDLSLICEFNATLWDTSEPDIAVTSTLLGDNKTVYYKGEEFDVIKKNEFPAYPLVIVKNNERIRVIERTKGDVPKYEFLCDEYNPKLNQNTRGIKVTHSTLNFPISPATDFVPASYLSEDVINAWQEFKDIDTAAHRDYIYYKMRKDKNYGSLNNRYQEQILRIKLLNHNCIDQDDPTFNEVLDGHQSLTYDDIISQMWSDGQLEIVINIYEGLANGGQFYDKKNISVSPRDLYDIKKAELDFKHKTAFHPLRNYKYTLSEEDLVPKWFYLENIFFTDWNLANGSYKLIFVFEEKDGTDNISQEISVSSAYAKNFYFKGSQTQSADFKIGDKLGFGVKETGEIGWTKDKNYNVNTKYTITTTKGSDDLGSITWSYMNPIIYDKTIENNVEGYNVYSVSSGSVAMTLLPVKR